MVQEYRKASILSTQGEEIPWERQSSDRIIWHGNGLQGGGGVGANSKKTEQSVGNYFVYCDLKGLVHDIEFKYRNKNEEF
jgi:hypothetical protein